MEDPERKPAKAAGFRGGRYLSAEASARGEWEPGGARNKAYDAYATTKQCELAAALEFARENPRIHVNAVEPGFAPGTSLSRDAPAALRLAIKYLLSPLAPYIRYWSTPKLTAPIIAAVLRNPEGTTGIYYDEKGKPMQASERVRDSTFRERVMAETRAFLAQHVV